MSFQTAASASGAERREHPRATVSDSVKIILPDRHVLEGVIVDRSLRGLRVRMEDVSALSADVTLLAPGLGSVFVARVVWRTAPYAGLSISRTVEMRSATGPDTAAFRKLWREYITG